MRPAVPEAMGCTCMQRIPVRQSNVAGSCASGVWGWDLSWTVIEPSLGFDLSLNPYRRCQFWCAYQAPPYRRAMFRATSRPAAQ